MLKKITNKLKAQIRHPKQKTFKMKKRQFHMQVIHLSIVILQGFLAINKAVNILANNVGATAVPPGVVALSGTPLSVVKIQNVQRHLVKCWQ